MINKSPAQLHKFVMEVVLPAVRPEHYDGPVVVLPAEIALMLDREGEQHWRLYRESLVHRGADKSPKAIAAVLQKKMRQAGWVRQQLVDYGKYNAILAACGLSYDERKKGVEVDMKTYMRLKAVSPNGFVFKGETE